jgi:tetratricopeptide (TPR) repeat protein
MKEVDMWCSFGDWIRTRLSTIVHNVTKHASGVLLETPVIEFDGRIWHCVHAVQTQSLTVWEYIPDGTSLAEWTELVSAVSRTGGMLASPEEMLPELRLSMEAKGFDGRIYFSVLQQSAHDLIYEWSIVDDVAFMDQFEIGRVIRGASAIHSVNYAARGIAENAPVRDAWLSRLKAVCLGQQSRADLPRPEAPRTNPASLLEIQRIVGILREEWRPEETAQRVALCRRALSLIDYSEQPGNWALLQFALGTHLTGQAHPAAEDIEAAIAAYRRALQVWHAETHGELWAQAMMHLGLTFRDCPEGDRARNIQHAATALLQALSVFSTEGKPLECARTLHHLTKILPEYNLAAADELGVAATELRDSLQTHTRNTSPFTWAKSMLELGRAFEALAEAQRKLDGSKADDHYKEALNCYTQVLDNPELRTGELKKLLPLFDEAMYRMEQLQYRGSGPVADPQVAEQERRWRAVYLRPLVTTGTLMLPNHFRDPDSLKLRFNEEPAALSLETILQRALTPYLTIFSMGGFQAPLGVSHIYTPPGGDWKEMLPGLLSITDLIFLVPHLSPGIMWEVELLIREDFIPKCLFVMPPPSPTYDVRSMWESAVSKLNDFGLRLPSYDEEGRIYRLDSAGCVAESWSFEPVWAATLFHHLKHLLPDRLREAPD